MTDSLTRLNAALADRYRIERELGQGGMATVYLAEDLKHRTWLYLTARAVCHACAKREPFVEGGSE